jgi:hypothetical protein
MVKGLSPVKTVLLTCDKTMRMRPVGKRNLVFITAASVGSFHKLTCSISNGKCEI